MQRTVTVVMWNEASRSYGPIDISIRIDMQKLAEKLARKALRNSTGVAKLAEGAIVGTINKETA